MSSNVKKFRRILKNNSKKLLKSRKFVFEKFGKSKNY